MKRLYTMLSIFMLASLFLAVLAACGVQIVQDNPQTVYSEQFVSEELNKIVIEYQLNHEIDSGQGTIPLPGWGWAGWIVVSGQNSCILVITVWSNTSNLPGRWNFEINGPCTTERIEVLLGQFNSGEASIVYPKWVIDTIIEKTREGINKRFGL